MLGFDLLIVVVVAAVVAALIGAGGRGAAVARVAAARRRLETALRPAGPANTAGAAEAARAQVLVIAGTAGTLRAADAAALVLACRRTASSDVVPVLVAALAHASPAVAADAAQVLTDLGSPGLRAVWQAVEGGASAPSYRDLLRRHPDWLFERLVAAFDQGGAVAVERHRPLWRDAELVARLDLLRGSDAINRMRAEAIRKALGSSDGPRVA